MKIVINKVFSPVRKYKLLRDIKNLLLREAYKNKSRLNSLSSSLNIDCIKIIKIAADNLKVIDTDKGFIITIDEVKKINNKDLNYWIRLINYGTLSIRGCNLISLVSKYISDTVTGV